MKHFEGAPRKYVRSVAAIAALAIASGCSAARPPAGARIDHSIKEPACTGVTLERIDHDNFRVLPVLSRAFVDPANVRSFMDFSEPSSPGSSPSTLPNTGGGVSGMQDGVGYELALQASMQEPGQLVMFDFQRHAPPDLAKLGGIPEGVPEISCPPANLGKLVMHFSS